MRETNIAAIDLNLLVALQALLAERHVTRAAARLGVTQPAMSHSLARLRDALGDPLLVRSKSGLQLTPRGAELVEPLDRLLVDAGALLAAPKGFEPKTSTRRFRIARTRVAPRPDRGRRKGPLETRTRTRIFTTESRRTRREKYLGGSEAAGRADRSVHLTGGSV
jgi:DNA-binding transcriptional LysR family regulator